MGSHWRNREMPLWISRRDNVSRPVIDRWFEPEWEEPICRVAVLHQFPLEGPRGVGAVGGQSCEPRRTFSRQVFCDRLLYKVASHRLLLLLRTSRLAPTPT